MEILKYMTEFENELNRKFFREMSIKNYVSCLGVFLKYFDGKKKEPKAINEGDIALIQKLAGHQNIKTTNLYLHTSHTLISKIQSPLNNIIL